MATSTDGRNTTFVSFICQQCYQPLKIDNSIKSLDLDSCLELESTSSTFFSNNADSLNDGSTSRILHESPNFATKHIALANWQASNDGNGFFLLGETANSISTDKISQKLKVSADLFDIMSGNTEVDHPLCEECTDNLLNKLDSQLNITEKELESYKELLAALENNELEDDETLDAEYKRLTLEESKLLDELEQVEKEHHEALKKQQELDEEEKRLHKEEQLYWTDYCEHNQALIEFEDCHESVRSQLQYVQNNLDKLCKTNVFNSAFHIWHKGHFGTINNFRLGRLPSVPVDWTEINAAWGQTVLLLYSLSKKIGLTFQRYRLVPYGNHSFLECIDDKSKELPLYGSGGFRFFWNTKFDHAMVAFLDCLQQFKEEVEKGDSKFYLPYRMEKGKIFDSRGSGSYSVKIQFNSEEHWTKALKFMLTNLKWGLAWVSSQFADKHICGI